MNLSILCGNLCKPIELKCTPSGKYVFQNTIAVKNDFKNKDGNYDSTFINIVVWGNQAEYLSKYANKGSKILLEGRISNRSYEANDGVIKYITEVIVEKAEILTYKKEENNTPVEQPKEEVAVVLSDEDLPF